MNCPLCGNELINQEHFIMGSTKEYNLCCIDCGVGFYGYDRKLFDRFICELLEDVIKKYIRSKNEKENI